MTRYQLSTRIIMGAAATMLSASLQGSHMSHIAWPAITLPSHTEVIDDAFTTLNGIPMHTQVFVSALSLPEIMNAFKQSLGTPLLVSSWNNSLILGKSEGKQSEYYVTIQLEAPVPGKQGSKGIIGISFLQPAYENKFTIKTQNSSWLSQLPPGSRIYSDMTAESPRSQARHFTITNRYSLSLNQHYLTRWMKHQGFEHQNSSSQASQQIEEQPFKKTLFFKGSGKEAIVTLHQQAIDHTTIVVNTVYTLEPYK